GSAQPAQDQVDELVTTPQATQRFARLAKQFQRLPSAFNEPVFQPPSGLLPPKTNPRPFAAPDPLPVLSKGDARRFLRQGSRLRAEVDEQTKHNLPRPATIDLPLKSEGTV